MSWESNTATDFGDLLVKLDAFLTKGHSLVPVYTGTGSGVISGIIGTSSTQQETITISFTSSTAFSVTGSVTGAMGSGTVDVQFNHAKVSFIISQGTTNWVSGDTISFVMTPPWVQMRCSGAQAWLNSSGLDATKIIDGSTSTYTQCVASSLPQYIGAKLLQATKVLSFRLIIYNTPSYGPSTYALEYSDTGLDGSWTAAATFTAQTWANAYEQRTHNVADVGAHLYWRINFTGSNSTYLQMSEITLFSSADGVNPLRWYGDAIWRAPGNGGNDQIYIGAGLQWNAVGAYWAWRLGGMVGFVAANGFTSQPGFFGTTWMSLWLSSIPYWFIASGKSVKVIAKVTTQYEQSYQGFLDCYMSPGNFPYPLLIGGSFGFQYQAVPAIDSTSYRYSDISDNHRAWWTPGGDGNYGHINYNYGHTTLRKVDASVITFQGCAGNSNVGFIYPTSYRSGAIDVNFQDTRLNLDGSVPMFPIIFNDGAPNCYGEPEGVMAISGQNQSAENILTLNRVDWLVVPNVMRTGVMDYVAYRLT